MTKFRIKSQDEMNKPFGKCVRFLEDLQFITMRRVEPTDDPKWFRRIPLAPYALLPKAPPLEPTGHYLEGTVINHGCVENGFRALDSSLPEYLGWYFEIVYNGYTYHVPQQIVDILAKDDLDYKLTARRYYAEVDHKDDRARLWAESLVQVYEEDMRRGINSPWSPDLPYVVTEVFEQKKALLAV
tara:strand:- start:187881 stop:188435 length:555 start_codon:yes stop_codon:yes gene_type:complete